MNREKMKSLLPVLTAYADGKPVQVSNCSGQTWLDYTGDIPNFNNENWTWRIKPLEFPKLPEGLEWHNKDGLTPEQVGSDRRLLVKGELDGRFSSGSNEHRVSWWNGGEWRTTNRVVGAASSYNTYSVPISTPFPEPPKPKVMVPLGLEDVPPGSVFRREGADGWFAPTEVKEEGIWHRNLGNGVRFTYFTSLQQARYHIKRPGEDWKPCEKESAS